MQLLPYALLRGAALTCVVASAASGQTTSPQDRPSGDSWTLEAVLTAAAFQHPLVEAAQARVTAARGGRRTAGALLNPIATYQVENAGFPGRSAPAGLDRETSMLLTVPLEPLFQRSPRVSRANEDVRAAEADLTNARRQVVLDAARAFHRVAAAQVAVAAAEETRAGLERLASFNAIRVAEGATPEGDLIRVQVEVRRAAVEVALEEVELAQARADLLPYLGRIDSTAAPFSALRVQITSPALPATELPTLATLVSRARERRPELLSARARVAAAGAEASYQRALTIRALGATIGSKRINGESSMIAGLSLPVPVFDQNRGEVQRASAERTAAEQELVWAERVIAAQVQGAYEGSRRLSMQLATLQQSFLEGADEARRITLVAYEEGAASLLQVLDASRTLGEARVTYYRLLFAQRQSMLELSVLTGNDPTTNLAPEPAVSPDSLPMAGGIR
jgi:outer membrane protein, heavy metal efflux system